MKQFVKAMEQLQNIFPSLSDAKLKESIFVGPNIRKLIKDAEFGIKFNATKLQAYASLNKVVKNFLENKNSPDFKEIVT